MKTRITFLAIFSILISFNFLNAQDSIWVRTYELTAMNQFDLRNSSTNGITAHRILHDAFRKGVKTRMGKTVGNISNGLFSFATTYMTMIWSHEFGHSLRAAQVGGNFKIHNINLPIPYTTMHLPDNITYENEALSVTGGFEVNYLTVRKIQREFISHNGTFNEDLSYGFVNRLMYPIYTSVIVRINPEDPDVWINTAGDPVHCALPVFENYADGKVFMEDGAVNPELVKFYNQNAIFGTFFNLLDPQVYKEMGATFGKSDKTRRPVFLIGDHQNGWTYGTLFNVSPLGYELYMNNYLHLNGKQFAIYAKYGNPYKNYGLGVTWHDMVKGENLNLSTHVDVWNQDIFGMGVSGELEMEYTFMDRIGIKAIIGYKTNGYVLGKQIDSGINAGIGLVYHVEY